MAVDTLARQDISSHDIDCIKYEGPSLTLGRIWSTCVKSMWRNKLKMQIYIYIPFENLACRVLIKYHTTLLETPLTIWIN